jgi:protein pelota
MKCLLCTAYEARSYGIEEVEAAAAAGAVDALLLTDGRLRAKSLGDRKRHVALVELVQSMGGSVHVFSTMHGSGDRLEQLCGVAAILRYAVS